MSQMVQLILQMIFFKKKPNQQCFLVQLLKIKFIVGWEEAFFKERKGGLKGYFHLPLPI